ncbi:Oligosaccharide translocation protein RFT1 [Ceratocystis platani]|uniref:Man(5)GlcNAc(2)-PP-dolichol translocation protein RFT1 n=1 Tax=Ceratocystis fimbriata f. sp. platani TaxID=88771 RepID=A0A0F8DM92_CERFI|nr:Oligosaccharide translocation protein RFT1 [Ceratocystis platani]
MSSRGAVFRGGLFLFLQQLLSRGLTFAAGQVLLRFLTAQKLGLATQLEVYYLSILFFARESLRVAAQRQPIAPGPSLGSSSGATPEAKTRSKDTSQSHSQHISQDPSQGGSKSSKAEQPRSAQEFKMCRSPSQTAINLGYIAVPLGAVVALVFGAMFRRVSTAADFVPLALNIYGSVASVPSKDGGTEKDIARSNIKENDGKAVADRKVTVSKAAHDLAILLKIYLLFSTIVVAIGPVAAPPAIEILAGTRWAADGAGDVLARYCYYIPLLALNGLTEAFVSSVATEKEVHSQSLWMTMFSAVFGAAGYFFLEVADMQASGLVFANIVNMACRIVWSCNGVINPLMRLAAMGVAAVPVVLAIGLSELSFLQQLYKSYQR